MIYEEIVKTINNYLGENFIIKYANNLDVDWKSILPEVQEKTAYGVLKVDSGTTTQLADTIVREHLYEYEEETDMLREGMHVRHYTIYIAAKP